MLSLLSITLITSIMFAPSSYLHSAWINCIQRIVELAQRHRSKWLEQLRQKLNEGSIIEVVACEVQ
jgi:hypothetical protein